MHHALLIALQLLIGIFAPAATPNGTLDVGVASVDITPTEPVVLAGSPSRSNHHRPRAFGGKGPEGMKMEIPSSQPS